MQSLYVHVPFCVVKCGYCDFTSYEGAGGNEFDRFLDLLDAELSLIGVPRDPVSVFIGGGTPTHLDPPRLSRLFRLLGAHVDLPGCPEVTIEANPESASVEKGRIARAAGVGRVSLGAQSFDPARLRFLDRAHDADRIAGAVAEMREAGFLNLSLDLMFGLPGQTPADWDRDLDAAIALEPDHLSCYQLTFEPGTRLGRELRRGALAPADEDACREMFSATRARLRDEGFVAYEISNFAGRGGRCAHNDHYWLQGNYVGVGPGAASHQDGWRGTNLKPLDAWARSLELGLRPTGEAETLSPDRRLGEAMWLGLRRADGVDLPAVERRLGLDPRERFAALLDRYVGDGFLEYSGNALRLTERGLLVGDSVGAAFLTAAV